MENKFIFMSLFLITGFLTGCGPRSLSPGAEQIDVISNTTYISNKCKNLGNISGDNTHANVSITAPEQALTLDDINFLKNEGEKLGANLVLFKQHQLTPTKLHVGPMKYNKYIDINTHSITGIAYLCPSNIIEKLRYSSAEHPVIIKDNRMLIIQNHSTE